MQGQQHQHQPLIILDTVAVQSRDILIRAQSDKIAKLESYLASATTAMDESNQELGKANDMITHLSYEAESSRNTIAEQKLQLAQANDSITHLDAIGQDMNAASGK